MSNYWQILKEQGMALKFWGKYSIHTIILGKFYKTILQKYHMFPIFFSQKTQGNDDISFATGLCSCTMVQILHY